MSHGGKIYLPCSRLDGINGLARQLGSQQGKQVGTDGQRHCQKEPPAVTQHVFQQAEYGIGFGLLHACTPSPICRRLISR